MARHPAHDPPPVLPAPAILGCERWFVRRGVPHFIEHYDASEHIWTRSLPLLVVIYVLRGLYALDMGKGVVFNLIALLLTLVVLVATWAIANLAGTVLPSPGHARSCRVERQVPAQAARH